MSDFPKRIWLQWCDEDITHEPEHSFKDCEEVTWCVDKQFAHDIEYIRADLAAKQEKDAERYRFLRDADNWPEGTDDWDALMEATGPEFDAILDRVIQEQSDD